MYYLCTRLADERIRRTVFDVQRWKEHVVQADVGSSAVGTQVRVSRRADNRRKHRSGCVSSSCAIVKFTTNRWTVDVTYVFRNRNKIQTLSVSRDGTTRQGAGVERRTGMRWRSNCRGRGNRRQTRKTINRIGQHRARYMRVLIIY